MKKTFVILGLALVSLFVACQKSNKSLQSKFTTAPTLSSTPIMVTVDFGNPPAGGGPCIGKGICDAVTLGQQSGTTVCFQVSPTNANLLLMGFHMSDLYNNQPEQVPYFSSSNGTYTFDGTASLTGSLFSPLNLSSNAAIDSGVVNPVTINGDSVTVSFTYAHN